MSDPLRHCFCLCIKPEVETQGYYIITLKVINPLEGERKPRAVGCGFKSRPEINTFYFNNSQHIFKEVESDLMVEFP